MGMSALWAAVDRPSMKCVQVLLEAAADPEIATQVGNKRDLNRTATIMFCWVLGWDDPSLLGCTAWVHGDCSVSYRRRKNRHRR